MHNSQTHGQHLLGLEQMVNIGAGIAAADGTVTFRVDGSFIPLVFGIFHVSGAGPGEQLGMACVSGRHDAVEEVHAPGDAFDDITRRADTHEIACLFLRHIGFHCLDDLIHRLGALPYRQTADGISGQVQVGDLLHVLDAQISVGAALVDAPEHLPGIDRRFQSIEAGVFRLAAHQPTIGPADGGFHIIVGCGILDALVKGHADVRAEIRLDLHAFLRAHKDFPSVQVGGKIDALLPDFPQTGQREDLKAAGIGQNRPVPGHELMQPSKIVNNLVTGPQMQVVGVGKLHLTADVFQIGRAEGALDGPLSADIHKHRRLDRAVGAGKYSTARPSFRFQQLKHNYLTL